MDAGRMTALRKIQIMLEASLTQKVPLGSQMIGTKVRYLVLNAE